MKTCQWGLAVVAVLAGACATVSREDIERTNTIKSWKTTGDPGPPEVVLKPIEKSEFEPRSSVKGRVVTERQCDVTYFEDKEVEIYQQRTPNGLTRAYLLGVGLGGAGGALLGTAQLVPTTKEDSEGDETHPRAYMYTLGSVAATAGAVFLINAIVASVKSIDKTTKQPNRTDTQHKQEACETIPLANTELFADEPELNLHNVSIGQTDEDGAFKFDAANLAGFKYPFETESNTLTLVTAGEEPVSTVEIEDWILEPAERVTLCDSVEDCISLRKELESEDNGRLEKVIAELNAKIENLRHDNEERPYQNTVSVTSSKFEKVSDYNFVDSKPYLEQSDDGRRIYIRQDTTSYEHMDGIKYVVKVENTAARYMLADIRIHAKAEVCQEYIFARDCRKPEVKQTRVVVLLEPGNTHKLNGFLSIKAMARTTQGIKNIYIKGDAALASQMSVPPQFNDKMSAIIESNFDPTSTEAAISAIKEARLFNGDSLIAKIEEMRELYAN